MKYSINEYRRKRKFYLEGIVAYRRKGLKGAVKNYQRALLMLRTKV